MIQRFVYEQPEAIIFGPGMRARIPDMIGKYGRRVLLITGKRWFNQSSWKSEFYSLLKDFKHAHLTCPGGEPTSEGLEELLMEAREQGPDVMLAVGGGSVIDTAKALSGLLPLNERVDDFLEGACQEPKAITAPGIPWIAVPTTSGTGAEVTKNAVIKVKALGLKRSLRSPCLLSSCAVVDPEIILECPLNISGTAGMDALTQLIESFVSRKAKLITRSLITRAFPFMLKALKDLPQNPKDLNARTGAAYGAMISGLALANSGLGAAHGFASGLGGLYDIPHGLICAVFIRPVLKANAEYIRKDCEVLAGEALQDQGYGIPKGYDAVQWLQEEIGKLFKLYGLPENLREYSIPTHQAAEIAMRSSGSSMSGNPKELSLEEREKIIRAVI